MKNFLLCSILLSLPLISLAATESSVYNEDNYNLTTGQNNQYGKNNSSETSTFTADPISVGDSPSITRRSAELTPQQKANIEDLYRHQEEN